MKKILLNPWTALITLAIVLAIRMVDPSFIESVRLRYFDTLLTQPRDIPSATSVITINIDEQALDKYGQWPFPRNIHAQIIEDLYARNAGLVVYNVLLADKDRFGQDEVLAATLRKHTVILPSVPSDKTKNKPRTPGSAVLGPEYMDQIVQYPGIIANVPSLENAAAGVGIVNTLPEVDGVNRRIPLVVTIGENIYPALSIETLRVAANDSTVQVKLNEYGVEKMRIPTFGPISTDTLGRIWIDWSQKNPRYSVTDLPKDLNKAIVVVGPTVAGISNPVPTSKGAVFPHEVQAAVISTMANDTNIKRPDYADGVEMLGLLLLGIILLFLTRYTYV